MSPTEPCPECECAAADIVPGTSQTWPLILAGLAGAGVVLAVGVAHFLVARRQKRNEYSSIPN